jgi:WD40 repeat protein
VKNATEVATLKGHEEGVGALDFSPDSKTLASSDRNRINLWDVAGGKTTPMLTFNASSSMLLFSSDGKTLASHHDGIHLWNLEKKEVCEVLKAKEGRVARNGMMYNPEGKLLAATVDLRGRAHLYDAVEGKEIATLEHQSGVDCLAFSRDGKMVVTADSGTIRLWDVATGKPKFMLKVDDHVGCFAFNPKGTLLAIGRRRDTDTTGGIISLHDTATGQELAVMKGMTRGIYHMVFSPDGKVLAACDSGLEKNIKLWSIPEVIKTEK